MKNIKHTNRTLGHSKDELVSSINKLARPGLLLWVKGQTRHTRSDESARSVQLRQLLWTLELLLPVSSRDCREILNHHRSTRAPTMQPVKGPLLLHCIVGVSFYFTATPLGCHRHLELPFETQSQPLGSVLTQQQKKKKKSTVCLRLAGNIFTSRFW